jgi:hypothetical protein
MNTYIPMLCAVAAVVLAGCAHSPPVANAGGPYVKPGLIMPTADQAERRGIPFAPTASSSPPRTPGADALDASSVAVPPGVKVFPLNRTVDPNDSNVMHEQHVIYRRESAPQWRLDAPADQKILVGPRVTDGRQDLEPLMTKELTAFLSDQRRATEANQKAITALFEAVAALTRQQEALARREIGKASERQTAPTPEDALNTPQSDGSQ